MDFLLEFLRQGALFVFYIAVAICGVLTGKALRARKDRKKAQAEGADTME